MAIQAEALVSIVRHLLEGPPAGKSLCVCQVVNLYLDLHKLCLLATIIVPQAVTTVPIAAVIDIMTEEAIRHTAHIDHLMTRTIVVVVVVEAIAAAVDTVAMAAVAMLVDTVATTAAAMVAVVDTAAAAVVDMAAMVVDTAAAAASAVAVIV